MRERAIFLFGFGVDEDGMALVEGTAIGILAGKTNWISLQQHRPKSQGLRQTVIDGALTMSHLGPLLEQFGDFGMNVKALRHADEGVGNLGKLFAVQPCVRFILRLETAAMISRPVFG